MGTPYEFRTIPPTLDQWAQFFSHLYADANRKRDRRFYTEKMAEHIGILCHEKFRREPQWFYEEFADYFAWTLGLFSLTDARHGARVPRVGGYSGLSQLLFLEYPNKCPSCGRPRCDGDTCQKKRKELRKNLRRAAQRLINDGERPSFSIQTFAGHIAAIYDNSKKSTNDAAAWLVQEQSELIAASARLWGDAGHGAAEEFLEEFSDVMAWLCQYGDAVLNELVESGYAEAGHTLDRIVWSVYGRGCPTCVERGERDPFPCKCRSPKSHTSSSTETHAPEQRLLNLPVVIQGDLVAGSKQVVGGHYVDARGSRGNVVVGTDVLVQLDKSLAALRQAITDATGLPVERRDQAIALVDALAHERKSDSPDPTVVQRARERLGSMISSFGLGVAANATWTGIQKAWEVVHPLLAPFAAAVAQQGA
jgi:hypothetical protein